MKILFAVPRSGCAFWRCHQSAKMMNKLGLAEVKWFDDINSQENMEELFYWGEVIVQQSSMGIPNVVTTKKLLEMGKTVVGDYDDLTFSVSPFNPSYKTLGLNEVKIKHEGGEHYLWQDGRGGFDIKCNYFRYKSLQDLLKMFNMITTTGQYIKSRYLEFNPNISILPNSIDFDLFKPFPKEDTGQVRIGWTPSDSHYSEIWMVKRIMRKIFNKYGDKVKLVILGNLWELAQEFNLTEMERHDFIGLEVYPLKLASLNLDIGLCPLDKIDFNRAKSQLKWSEYSSMKVPSVVSKIEAYDCVEDYKTGLVADTEDEFYNKLCELIDSKELRDKISYHAYDKNYEDYNLEKNIILWMEAYEQARETSELPMLEEGQLVKDIPKI